MKVSIPSEIGDQNKYAILKLIKENDGISRNYIAKSLHISATAVSKNVNALISAGIVREEGTNNASLGRKPIMLHFNSEILCVLGIEIMPQVLRGAISDLKGTVLKLLNVPSMIEQGAASVLSQLDQLINTLMDMCPDNSRVATAAIAFPALSTQYDENNLMSTFAPEWKEIDIRKHVEEKFNLSVTVKNDVELDLIGECYKGAGVNYKNIFYLKYGEGFAARAMINGKLLGGYNGAAGELGYYISDIPKCGSFICPGVTEQYLCRDIFNEYRNKSGKQIDETYSKLKFRDLVNFADNGDEVAKDIVNHVVNSIAVIIANMVLMLDPEIVILGAEASFLRESDVIRVEQILKATCPFVPQIVLSTLGFNSAIIGGIQIALKNAEGELVNYWRQLDTTEVTLIK